MGGSNGHSDDLSCGEMYEPEIDDWTPVPELRTNRCNAGNAAAVLRPSGFFTFIYLLVYWLFPPVRVGVCALNGKLYIVGGSDPYGQKGLKNCDVFDPVTKSWTSCAPLNIRKFVVWLKPKNCVSVSAAVSAWVRCWAVTPDVRLQGDISLPCVSWGGTST